MHGAKIKTEGIICGGKKIVPCQMQNLHKKSYNSVQLILNRKDSFPKGK